MDICRKTKSQRPYALVTDRATGETIEVHPQLFDALVEMSSRQLNGHIEVHMVNGSVANVMVRYEATQIERSKRSQPLYSFKAEVRA